MGQYQISTLWVFYSAQMTVISLVNQTLLLGDAYRLEIISAPLGVAYFVDVNRGALNR